MAVWDHMQFSAMLCTWSVMLCSLFALSSADGNLSCQPQHHGTWYQPGADCFQGVLCFLLCLLLYPESPALAGDAEISPSILLGKCLVEGDFLGFLFILLPGLAMFLIKSSFKSGLVLLAGSLCLFALSLSPACLFPALAHDWCLKGAFSSSLLLSRELVRLAKRCPSVPLLGTICGSQNQVRKCTGQAKSGAGKLLFKHTLKAISNDEFMLIWAAPCCKEELCPSCASEISCLLLLWVDTGTHLVPDWNQV